MEIARCVSLTGPPGVVHFLFEVSTVVLVASGCFWPISAIQDWRSPTEIR